VKKSNKDKIKIRKAKKSDSKIFLKLVDELAAFEKLNPPDKKGKKQLLKAAFSQNPKIKILISECGSKITGYAIYFFTYSSFKASRTLYLEDIFILEEFRNRGTGKLFFKKLLNIAKKNKCGRMEWVVLDWNENALNFYDKLGAIELSDWKTFRINL